MLKFTVRLDGYDALLDAMDEASGKAQHAVAALAGKDTSPYVPALTGSLDMRTRVIDNMIVYPGPYARYLYYGKVMVDASTGKGPMRITAKDGTEVIRFRKGATLKPTSRPLKYSKKMHSKAQSHWFEASKAANLEKWIRAAGKVIDDEI